MCLVMLGREQSRAELGVLRRHAGFQVRSPTMSLALMIAECSGNLWRSFTCHKDRKSADGILDTLQCRYYGSIRIPKGE